MISPSSGRRIAGWLALVLCASAALGLARRAAEPNLGPGSIELRVIGASNRPADQRVKLEVRDVVLAALGPGLRGARTAAAAQRYVEARLPAVRLAARAAAARSGQSVAVAYGEAPLPRRQLGWLTFPATRAPALIVTLGAGAGHNWWTVLFPPLALVTVRGDLVVVGPAGAAEPVADLDAVQRARLLAWVSGRTGLGLDGAVAPGGPGGLAGGRVQVRFLLWDLARDIPWAAMRAAVVGALGA